VRLIINVHVNIIKVIRMDKEKTLAERCRNLITELGLGTAEDIRSITPLTGGVSSDIAVVNLGSNKVCVKFALPKLKVAEEWHAKVERNLAEYRWLDFVSTISPRSTPKLLGISERVHGFAMEFVEGDDTYLWKQALLDGLPDNEEARKVGRVLGNIHRSSTTQIDLKNQFQNQEDFFALRIEPYLVHTAAQHREIARDFESLVRSLSVHEHTLVHGDVSPKNIIFRKSEPLFLDAECATIGDPCFDISFCLNHLVLKAVHLPPSRELLLRSVNVFWSAYRDHVSWESSTALEERVCKLLPALMLARIDGKSPVEYLHKDNRLLVKTLSIELIKSPPGSLSDLTDRVHHYLKKKNQ